MQGAPRIPTDSSLLVIACGALARELVALTHHGPLAGVIIECLPPELHDQPQRIPDAVRQRIHRARRRGHPRILVGYADCGTGGRLDAVCEQEGVGRLPGAHCYELFAGPSDFAELHDREPGTFYVTDFLVRSFDRLVVGGLGLDRHPDLRDVYFANYRRLVHLAQVDDPDLDAGARRAARRLGLQHERRFTGRGRLAAMLADAAAHTRPRTLPDVQVVLAQEVS